MNESAGARPRNGRSLQIDEGEKEVANHAIRASARGRAGASFCIWFAAACSSVPSALDTTPDTAPPAADLAVDLEVQRVPKAAAVAVKTTALADAPAPAGTPAHADRLSIGDEVRIVVVGQADLSTQLPVPPRGAIELPVIGSLELSGRTVAEVAQELRQRLAAADYVVHPEVAVSVTRFAPRRIFVVEGVMRPEAYELPIGAGLHLTQVIALAGGLSPGADPSHVTILRRPRNGAPHRLAVDLRAILDTDQVAADPILEQDDTVIVRDLKQGEQQVFVTGKVRTPGAYRFSPREGLSFLQAIVLAGGLDKFANPARAALLRRTEDGRVTLPVDLERILAGNLDSDLALQSGDVVFVPESFF